MPGEIIGRDTPSIDALQEFTTLLEAEGAFHGMTWHDAKHAATAIIVEAIHRRGDTPQHLRNRARDVLAGAMPDSSPSAVLLKAVAVNSLYSTNVYAIDPRRGALRSRAW